MVDSTKIGGEIIDAGASGDLAKLQEIKKKVGDDDFRKICDVISKFCNDRRVLHHAAELGNLQICEFLIENAGVYIDVLTDREHSPLMLAVKADKVDTAEYLIREGAQVNISSDKGFTALHYAVEKGNVELMKLLLKEHAHIDAESVDGTPLQYAASHGSVEVVKFLLENKAKPDAISLTFGSPLISAIKSRSFECMELLLKDNANPNQILCGLNSLAHAAREGDTEYLKRLIEAGADPKLQITVGLLEPIEHAAMANNLEGVKILFKRTERIPHYTNWSVDGIMTYCHSDETKTKREMSRRAFLDVVDKKGKRAVKRRDYIAAIVHYTGAIVVEPSSLNPKWLANRSLCFTRKGMRVPALHDAEECVKLSPEWAKAHCREGSAWMLFQNYYMASRAFSKAGRLVPRDKDIAKAFISAELEYRHWLVSSLPRDTSGLSEISPEFLLLSLA